MSERTDSLKLKRLQETYARLSSRQQFGFIEPTAERKAETPEEFWLALHSAPIWEKRV